MTRNNLSIILISLAPTADDGQFKKKLPYAVNGKMKLPGTEYAAPTVRFGHFVLLDKFSDYYKVVRTGPLYSVVAPLSWCVSKITLKTKFDFQSIIF